MRAEQDRFPSRLRVRRYDDKEGGQRVQPRVGFRRDQQAGIVSNARAMAVLRFISFGKLTGEFVFFGQVNELTQLVESDPGLFAWALRTVQRK